MVVILYYLIGSPPVRSVMLTLKTLGIPCELKQIHVIQGDQRSEEFLKINPQHTIPTIQDDDGFVIWESHAINAYLVNKYAKDDKLYPKELKARAIVDQRLHFDTGILFPQIRTVSIQGFSRRNITKVTDEIRLPIEEAYEFLEKFLEQKKYIAGNDYTIADFSIMTTLGNVTILAPLKKDKFPLIVEYMKRCDSNIPGLKELNDEGIRMYREFSAEVNYELP